MFNNFVKSMMALCMVTSGWSSNGIDGRDYLAPSGGVTEVAPGSGPITAVGNDDKLPLDGGKSPRKISDDSVQSKTSHEISSQEEPTSDGSANTSTSSDEGTSPQKEGGVVVGARPMNDEIEDLTANKNPEIKMSNSSGAATEAAVIGRQANGSWDARTIDSNQLGTAEENSGINDVSEEVSNKVVQLNFLTGQYKESEFYTPEEAKTKVIKVLQAIQPNLEKVYNCDNKNVTFSNLLFALNESRQIWEDSEDLNDFKKIVINLANGEVGSKHFKDDQVLEAIWDMMSRRDYGYDY